MSWIIGASGIIDKDLQNILKKLAHKPLYQIEEENLFILAGGIKPTCHYINNLENRSSILSVGVGISHTDNEFHLIENEDWQAFTSDTTLEGLNGHFILIEWDKNEIRISTDKLGLRDIYYFKNSRQNIIFSTRLDWLVKISGAKINFKEFGSRWILFNQISRKSVFDEIERVSSGDSILINRLTNSLSNQKNYWVPNFHKEEFTPNTFSNLLEKLVTFPLSNNQMISLSLSGGMDSRLLLSFLLKNSHSNWYSHTFGDNRSADSVVVKKIISDLKIHHEQIDLPLPDIEGCIAEIKEYVSATIINSEASAILQLRNYNQLSGRDEIVIDGGFGEVWRRDFFNRLLLTGYKSLLRKDARGILPFMQYHRASIFNQDINDLMYAGSLEQLQEIFTELPAIEVIGAENWIDLFAIKTRLVNYYSYEQARLDTIISGFMPFVQPILLENIFQLNITHRKNGKLFKYMIDKNFKKLKHYPLAKSEITYPFWFNTTLSRVWKILSRKLKVNINNDNNPKKLIQLLSPYILDKINSSSVKQCEFYNYTKLIALSDSLNNNELTISQINELDWWLSFELFREENKIK